MDYQKTMVAAVGLTVSGLEDNEVAALFMALQMGGIEPHHHGYEKLKPLRINPDGTMHPATIEALSTSLQRRIAKFPG